MLAQLGLSIAVALTLLLVCFGVVKSGGLIVRHTFGSRLSLGFTTVALSLLLVCLVLGFRVRAGAIPFPWRAGGPPQLQEQLLFSPLAGARAVH